MLGLISRRLIQLVPILLGVTFLTFFIVNLLPGSTALAILGDQATTESIARLNHQLGLDRPLPVQYVDWLVNALQGRLGFDLLNHRSVSSTIANRMPVDIELGLLAISIALACAIPTAVAAAWRPGSIADRASSVISMGSVSLPSFVLALVLVLLFAVRIPVFQPTGFVPISAGLPANLRSLILPAVSLAAFPFGLYVQVLRGDLIKQLTTGTYIETARMKGASEGRIIFRHALPNALLGLVTVVALNLGIIAGGSVLIEQIFALPGMGQTLVIAINARNSPVVQGIVSVLAVVVVSSNLLADILYTVVDPRIRDAR